MSAVCPNGHDSTSADYCDICGAPIPAGASSAPAAASAPPASSGNSLDLPAPTGPKECPNCQTPNAESSLFCEACGYDFTTGALPAGAVTNVEAPPQASDIPAGVVAAQEESAADDTPDGSGELAGLEAAEELDADGESVSAMPEAGEGEPGEGEPGDIPDLGGAAHAVPPRIPFQWVAEVWIDPDWYADQQAEEPLPSAGLPIVVPMRVASALIGRASSSRQIQPDIDCSANPGVSRRHAQLTTDGSRWFVEDLQSSNGTFVGPASGPLPADPIAVGPKAEVGDNRIYVGAWTRIVVRRATDEEIAIG